jgi:hypothetical protein
MVRIANQPHAEYAASALTLVIQYWHVKARCEGQRKDR